MHARAHQTGKQQITFAEYLAIMETVPLHEDPRQILKDAFSIFDTYDEGKYGCMHRIG